MKENIVLADCDESEIASLLDGLNAADGQPFSCVSRIANGTRTGWISELRRYAQYFLFPLEVFRNRGKYGVVLGWQQFYALIFCFYCQLFRVKKTCTVVALNFTYKPKGKGLVGRIYRAFMEKCLCTGYMDALHVLSAAYADQVAEEFGFPRERVIVSPFGVDDEYAQWKESEPPAKTNGAPYAMAIGRSNRDYDFLIRAWQDMPLPLFVISDTYKRAEPLPKGVTIVDNVTYSTQYPWIAHARMVLMPIADGRICSGDTVLLTAMCFARTLIVTHPSTLGEMYIEDGQNGYLVRKDEAALGALVRDLMAEKLSDTGEAARKSFLERFTREAMGRKIREYLSE